jgi:hypothetical protein
LANARKAAIDRVDELSAAIHRETVALRQEMHTELEDLKRDVFSAVMSLSALHDKLGVTDSRTKEVTAAITRSLTDRVDQQKATLESALAEIPARMDDMINRKVNHALHIAIQDLIRQHSTAGSTAQT